MNKARYVYSHAECGGEVSKTPCGTTEGKKGIKSGLHGWRCSCGAKGVKVVRKMA